MPEAQPLPASLPASPPLLSIRDGIASIVLNRPAHRNRLHDEDLQTLLDHTRRINADASVRVVVLTGTVLGARPVFCAGYHIGEFDRERDGANPTVQFGAVVDAVESLAPATVCALNGSVYGGATDLVLACDFRVGIRGIEMRMPAAALGIHYYPSGLRRYVSRLGVDATKDAFLTARPISAERMLAMGYLTDLCDAAQLDATVRDITGAVLGLAPLAVRALKQSINEIGRGDYDLQRLQEREQACQLSEDFAEGRRAFQERRAARFSGR